jgi:hypothetical protein
MISLLPRSQSLIHSVFCRSLAPWPTSGDSVLADPLQPTNEWHAVAKIAAIKLREGLRQLQWKKVSRHHARTLRSSETEVPAPWTMAFRPTEVALMPGNAAKLAPN